MEHRDEQGRVWGRAKKEVADIVMDAGLTFLTFSLVVWLLVGVIRMYYILGNS